MARLPPRRMLRSIVQDAISDREEFDDPEFAARTAASIASYRDLMPKLADAAGPLGPDERHTLARACDHARIWREGLVDAWSGTGDKAAILETRQDVERITRTEDALGVTRHWLSGGPEPEGVRTVTLEQLRAAHGI